MDFHIAEATVFYLVDKLLEKQMDIKFYNPDNSFILKISIHCCARVGENKTF